ncbi:hypothetical protein DQ04_02261030 [Trypanosoma grayi]|uniref:hypothetical protein n=1 Tax=Trypanosoma grayi TaxID=71804 RepID=UPI0004F4B765|nr:hypothetical protein DQ04_02261030 [Trypanosoma grayi]KEG11804.1 hypothetical protein DQ04_02261030 [Trypanosoma grayi]
MCLQFNWDRLDVTAAEAIRSLVNSKIEEELRRRAHGSMAGGDASATTCSSNGGSSSSSIGIGSSSRVEGLHVTSIEWGNVPPFVELLELGDAVDFGTSTSDPNAHDPVLARQEAAAHRPSPVVSSLLGGDCMSETESSGGGGPTLSATKWMSTTRTSASQPHTPVADALAPLVGPGGLYVCLHVTYGGPMRVSVSAVLRHDIVLGPTTLPVRMPLALHFSKMDMDFYLCVNLHRSTCRVWIEPGKLSTSPITRMNIMAVFGERRAHTLRSAELPGGAPPACDNLEASDAWTHVGSSHLGSEEEEDAVFMDESVISQFVLAEIRAVMQEKMMYPHFVEMPLFA